MYWWRWFVEQGSRRSWYMRSSACLPWLQTPSGRPSASPPPCLACGPRPHPYTAFCSTTWVCPLDPWATLSRRPLVHPRPLGPRPPASTPSDYWTGGSAPDPRGAARHPPPTPSTTIRRRRCLLVSCSVYNLTSTLHNEDEQRITRTTNQYTVNNTWKVM